MAQRRVHLDFETYSKADLRKVGTSKYCEDPSTEPLCLAYAIDDLEPRLWVAGEDPPERLFRWIGRGHLLCAWNAEFEIPFWREVCVRKLGWPDAPLEQWRDTAAVALAHALPANLKDAGSALGLDVTKDPRGERLVRKLSRPRKPTKRDPRTRWTPESAPEDFAALYDYCRQDVRSERAIGRALPAEDLPPEELETWRLTVEMNLRGWSVDARCVDRMLELLDRHRKLRLSELRELTDGELKTDGQREAALAWLGRNGVHLPDYQAKTIEKALERGLPEKPRRFLEIRQELSKASVKKYQAMRERRCRDGTIKNNVLYHGAGTGRDAGRGLQIQNLRRASLAEDEAGVERALRLMFLEHPLAAIEVVHDSVPEFASKGTRSMLVASEGCVLYGADYSSIENRIAVWYPSCRYGIGIFQRGLDEYRKFATSYYHVDYDRVTGAQRNHSKHAVLGCVFGMAWRTFMKQAERFGSPTTEEVAKRTVAHYRSLYAEVVEAWHELNRSAIRCVRTGKPVTCVLGRIRFRLAGGFLLMRLPSGRELAYSKPKVEMKRTPWGERRPTVTHMGIDSFTKKWTRLKVSPGRWFENAVQALARDVMMHGAKRTTAAGYRLVGRIHDELVSERPIGEGSLEEYVGLMGNPPWLLASGRGGIPIVAKGWTGKRFRK